MKSSEDNAPITKIRERKKSFEKLKTEIENLFSESISNQCHVQSGEILTNLYHLKQLVNFCISDTENIDVIYGHVEELKKEKEGFKLQAKRLIEENVWLREQLKMTQDKLQKKELDFIEIEESNKSLSFLLELQSNNIVDNSSTTKISLNLDESKSQVPSINMDASMTNSTTMSFNNMTSVVMDNNSVVSQNFGVPYCLPVHEVSPRLKTLHQLVIQYATQGRYEIAIPLCKQTLQDLERSSGHYHPDVATMLNILALVYRDKGDFQEAVESLTEALEIRKKTLGPDSPKVAATLNNLSVLYAKQGNHAEAEPLCRDALKIRESILGSHHPDVAKQLNNLALLCHNQGKYEEVEKYYQRALNIYLTSLPSTDHNVVKTKNSLASSYIKQGRFLDAEILLKNILNEAMEKQWSGRERDAKSKPIWTIAEEREKMKSRSMSMEILPSAIVAEMQINKANGMNDQNMKNICEPATYDHPPFGFEIKHKNKEDKIILLNTLKLLASLYTRQNKETAANIIEEWLIWAGRALGNYEKDVKWISYESSLAHCDLYSSQQDKSQTFWYPTPSPSKRSMMNLSVHKPTAQKASFLLLDSSSPSSSTTVTDSQGNNSSSLMRLSDYSRHHHQPSFPPKSKLPTYLSPYLYKTQIPVVDHKYPKKSILNLRKATSMTTLANVKDKT